MKGPCRDCWDPVDKEGEELCDWCKMTPEQRKSKQKINTAILAVIILIVAGLIGLSVNPP